MEYGSGAALQVVPALTSLELEKQEDGTVRIKAGVAGQYVVYDRKMLQIVEDAYSLQRPVQLQTQMLSVLSTVEMTSQTLVAAQEQQLDDATAIDVCFMIGQPARLYSNCCLLYGGATDPAVQRRHVAIGMFRYISATD